VARSQRSGVSRICSCRIGHRRRLFQRIYPPLVGPDHLLAMVSVGLWGAELGAPAVWTPPITFPLITAIGGADGIIGMPLTGAEIIIARSVTVLGGVVAMAARLNLAGDSRCRKGSAEASPSSSSSRPTWRRWPKSRWRRTARSVCAVDCGTVVNPDTVRAQIQSAIIFGITAALFGEITLKDGRVEQTNFDTYQMLRMNEAPAVEVHLVQNFEPPGGMGECGTSAIVPAVTNAIFAATVKRLRKLPIDTATLRQPV
jgi:hypothetical protein